MKSADLTELEALKMVGGGCCLAHARDATWMVAGALPGERILVEEVHRRAGVIEAQTTAVLANTHPARLERPCPHSGPCGGCDWPHVDVTLGARLKAEAAAESARSRPDIASALRTAPIQVSPPSYRLRARLHWDPTTAALGFFARRSKAVHPLSDCRVISPRLLASIPDIRAALERHTTIAGDFEWLENLDASQAIGAFVAPHGTPGAAGPVLPPQDSLKEALDGFHLLGREGRAIGGWGLNMVEMDTPIPLKVPAGAFFQGNRHLVNWLFQRVAELAGPDPVPTWDLHAGVGFLAAAAQWAAPRKTVLVEPYGPSARAAADNLGAAQVAAGATAESYCHRHRDLPSHALVITDPPRAGLSKGLRRRLAEWSPARILMLACDTATWARDTGYLIDRGYRLEHVELIDLFPSTHHVEVLAVLEHR